MVVLKLRPKTDFMFTVTAWEMQTLRHLHRVVEDNIDDLLLRYGIADGSGELGADLHLLSIEERVPPLFRVPVIAMAWSLYEACLIETARYFAPRLSLTYSVDSPSAQVPDELRRKWQRWHILQRAKHFFERELNLELTESVADYTALNSLRVLRNVLPHTGGRSSESRPSEWDRLKRIASRARGLEIHTGYIVATSGYVQEQIDVAERCSDFLVAGARQLVADRGWDSGT